MVFLPKSAANLSHLAGRSLLGLALLLAIAGGLLLGLDIALRDHASHGGRQLLLRTLLRGGCGRVGHPLDFVVVIAGIVIILAVVLVVAVGRAVAALALLLLGILVPVVPNQEPSAAEAP